MLEVTLLGIMDNPLRLLHGELESWIGFPALLHEKCFEFLELIGKAVLKLLFNLDAFPSVFDVVDILGNHSLGCFTTKPDFLFNLKLSFFWKEVLLWRL